MLLIVFNFLNFQKNPLWVKTQVNQILFLLPTISSNNTNWFNKKSIVPDWEGFNFIKGKKAMWSLKNLIPKVPENNPLQMTIFN